MNLRNAPKTTLFKLRILYKGAIFSRATLNNPYTKPKWDPKKAPAIGVDLKLPVYAVLAYKLVFDWRQTKPSVGLKWEPGENRYLLVKPEPEPTTVEVDFRSPLDQETHGAP